jgi:hypothetical protein
LTCCEIDENDEFQERRFTRRALTTALDDSCDHGKMTQATGPFEVKMTAQPPDEATGGNAIGRFALDKQYHGDLEATSQGQMLAVRTSVPGSAGYVAMELVSGTLHGCAGTFVLQHSGIMDRGAPQLSVAVVPDSGTGQLAGLAGKMTIAVVEGKHSYDFEYTFGA